MSDIEIARAASKKPIQEIGAKLDIPSEHLLPYGHDKAKVSADFIASVRDRPDGHLILVTAVNPTPAGEGKTTTTVGLGDGLNAIGKKAAICIREASLGPCFGMKGGAAGGGYAQVIPMEDMNLHFTGDFHAITSAHNLLAALLVIPLVLLARLVSVGLPLQVLRRAAAAPPGTTRVLTWAGLRGGISVALALSIPPGPQRDLILGMTYCVVVFSIVVQGLTVGPLMRRLGLVPATRVPAGGHRPH